MNKGIKDIKYLIKWIILCLNSGSLYYSPYLKVI